MAKFGPRTGNQGIFRQDKAVAFTFSVRCPIEIAQGGQVTGQTAGKSLNVEDGAILFADEHTFPFHKLGMQSFKGIQPAEQQKIPKILLRPTIGGRDQLQGPNVEFMDQPDVV